MRNPRVGGVVSVWMEWPNLNFAIWYKTLIELYMDPLWVWWEEKEEEKRRQTERETIKMDLKKEKETRRERAMIRNPMQKLKRAREVKRGHDGVRMRSTTWQTRRKHQTGRQWQGKQEKPGGAFRLKSGAGNSSACQSTCHRDGSIVNRFYSHLHFGPLWEWDVLWCLTFISRLLQLTGTYRSSFTWSI